LAKRPKQLKRPKPNISISMLINLHALSFCANLKYLTVAHFDSRPRAVCNRFLPNFTKSMPGLARNWLVWRRDHYGHSHFILLKQKRIWKNRFSRVKNFSRSVMPNSCFWLFKVFPVYKTSPALSVYSHIFITGTFTGSESSNFHLNYSWAWDLIQIFCSVSKMDKIN